MSHTRSAQRMTALMTALALAMLAGCNSKPKEPGNNTAILVPAPAAAEAVAPAPAPAAQPSPIAPLPPPPPEVLENAPPQGPPSGVPLDQPITRGKGGVT